MIAPGAFDPDVGARLAAVEGAGAVTPVRFGQTDHLTDDGSQRVDVTVIDPASYFEVAGFAWVDGDDESAASALETGGAVLLPDAIATGDGIDPGDVVRLRTSEGVAEFTLAGTYAVIGPGFGVVAGTPDAARFGAGRPNAFLVDAAPGVDPDALGVRGRDGARRGVRPDHRHSRVHQGVRLRAAAGLLLAWPT